ncbi:MAG: LPS export ABC transporter permease LptF [Pseudomonadota bacterium]|uniref:LPS export ABC transporter permease LptF n=1 Tax=Pseudooceanicola nitratireducens TaxID=517719 RepID=UPI002EAC8AD8|nr:LPS export ABC transporter permease LptF [Pseudomonadota bacterium]
MARFDRYLLSQFLVLFGFFALVLVSIYWINQAVRLFDALIGDGQTAWVFLELTALSLPNVIRITLPMACFAAAVYVTNRLSSESELVVMQATGFSPWRLARPVMWFGLIVALMMSLMTHFLVPMSMTRLQQRQEDVQDNITARLLTEGTFLHPVSGITFYIREIDADGTLRDVFLSDRRDPATPQTFTAARAYLVPDRSGEDARAKLVMVEGLSQTLRADTKRLFTTHFRDFTYDIGRLFGDRPVRFVHIRHLPTWDLLSDPQGAAERTGFTLGQIANEAHGRFAQALLCLSAALIGFATLLTGGYSRFGVWQQIVLAIVLIMVVKSIEGAVSDPVSKDAALWPLAYVPGAAGLGIGALLLWIASRGSRPWLSLFRRRAA